MARKTPPSFDFYPDDFVGGTMHMEPIEVGMYMRCICMQWGREALPKSASQLQRIMGVTEEEFARHWPVVAEKFTEKRDGTLVNERLEVERSKKVALSQSRSEAARKRWDANASDLHDAKSMQREVGSRKKEVGSGKKEEGDRKKAQEAHEYTPDFERFWEACPRKTAKGYAAECYERAVESLAKRGESDPHEFLRQRIERFAASPAADVETKRIPHPSTWLNQKRYDDDLSQWREDDDPRGNMQARSQFMEDD